MSTSWAILGTATFISIWFVLTYVWMHELDNTGEPWWAVYIPVYNLVCMLRAVEASPYWAWVIVPVTVLAAGAVEYSGRSTMTVGERRGILALAFLIAAIAPWWINARLVQKKRELI